MHCCTDKTKLYKHSKLMIIKLLGPMNFLRIIIYSLLDVIPYEYYIKFFLTVVRTLLMIFQTKYINLSNTITLHLVNILFVIYIKIVQHSLSYSGSSYTYSIYRESGRVREGREKENEIAWYEWVREYRFCVDGEKRRKRRKTEDRIKWRSQRGGGGG